MEKLKINRADFFNEKKLTMSQDDFLIITTQLNHILTGLGTPKSDGITIESLGRISRIMKKILEVK